MSGSTYTVTIPDGAVSAQVAVDPTTDTTVELDENVVLTVAAGTGYTPAGSAATGVITNDDTAAVFVSP